MTSLKSYSQPSKAQKAKLEQIEAYFEKRTGHKISTSELKPLGSDYRKAWFSVKTKGLSYPVDGCYGSIGRRGKVEVSGLHGLSYYEEHMGHYQRMLN